MNSFAIGNIHGLLYLEFLMKKISIVPINFVEEVALKDE